MTCRVQMELKLQSNVYYWATMDAFMRAEWQLGNHLLLLFKYVLAFKIISQDHNFLINTGNERDACSKDEQKKNILNWKKKKSNRKKKPIRILKKLTGSVRFQFYKLETKKSEPKPEKIEKNRVKSVWPSKYVLAFYYFLNMF